MEAAIFVMVGCIAMGFIVAYVVIKTSRFVYRKIVSWLKGKIRRVAKGSPHEGTFKDTLVRVAKEGRKGNIVKSLLLFVLIGLIGCASGPGKVTKLSIGNCEGFKGIFIPLEEYGNFDVYGRMGCHEGITKFAMIFNGKLIGVAEAPDEDGNPIPCKNKPKKLWE